MIGRVCVRVTAGGRWPGRVGRVQLSGFLPYSDKLYDYKYFNLELMKNKNANAVLATSAPAAEAARASHLNLHFL